jgi:hypothetical protein
MIAFSISYSEKGLCKESLSSFVRRSLSSQKFDPKAIL